MEVQETLGGRYKLLHELGTGGMAVVWRARDEVLGRPVAVKVLAGRFAGDPQSRARIRDEARAAATLSHPNIAQVYDYGESSEGGTPLPYVVMELINGPTLQQRVADAPLPPRTIFRICGEVAAALAAAHADGLVHRDIKMANIMVTATGAKVVDFGIAAAVGPAAPEEMLVGTPAYLAPERLTGDAIQAASDIYALGVLLYRLLAHEPPWTVETTTQMLNAHIYIEPSPLPALPGVPREVADLIDRCLRKDPAERPTAAEVSATLGDAAEAALASVRAKPTQPATVPSPRAVDRGDYDESTSSSLDRRPPVPGPSRSATQRTSRVASGAAAGPVAFVPGAEIGAVRSALPGEAEPPSGLDDPRRSLGRDKATNPSEASPGGRRRAAEAGVVGLGESSGSGPEGGTSVLDPAGGRARRPGAGGSWVPEISPAQSVRKKRFLVAGAGIAALVAAVLTLWGLAGRHGPAGRNASGVIGEVASAAPSGSARPTPSASRDDSPAAGIGSAGPGHPLFGVTGPAASAASSVAPTASSAEGSPQPSTDPSSGLAPSGPVGTRLSSDGGVVYAVCSQGKGQLTSWQANPGYTVQKLNAGPAFAPDIIFRGGTNRYRMTVTCVSGTPTPLVLPL